MTAGMLCSGIGMGMGIGIGGRRRTMGGVRFVGVLLLVAGCEAPQAGSVVRPLVGGELEDGYPGAVALLADIDGAGAGEEVFCSGTLVSPRVIATAAHCIDEAGANPEITAFFGANAYGDGTRIGVSRAEAHPGWTGELAGSHDIGLLLLGFAADPAWAIPLHHDAITDDDIGHEVRRIGFGRDDPDEPDPDGAKRSGTTTIGFVSTMDWFLAGDDTLITCNGDSGGAVLIDRGAGEELAGVHSFGFDCQSGSNGSTRLDLYADDFVTPWIAENDASCGSDNLCARTGCSDDPDCLPCGPDGTCVDDCPLPDLDCRTQDMGEICQADSQCLTELCVFWQDDPTTHFCSRPCDGDGDCPDGMSCQSISPFGDVCYYDGDPPGLLGSSCEGPTECGSYACDQGVCVTPCDLAVGQGCPADFECAASSTSGDDTYYCYPLASGDGGCGCRSSGNRSAPFAPLVVLVALLLAVHRSRRLR